MAARNEEVSPAGARISGMWDMEVTLFYLKNVTYMISAPESITEIGSEGPGKKEIDILEIFVRIPETN